MGMDLSDLERLFDQARKLTGHTERNSDVWSVSSPSHAVVVRRDGSGSSGIAASGAASIDAPSAGSRARPPNAGGSASATRTSAPVACDRSRAIVAAQASRASSRSWLSDAR